jgi:type I restriction enzyme S subunit
VRKGDILICVRNGSRGLIGKCAVVDDRASGYAFGAFMSIYRSDDSDYIYQLFHTDDYKRQINENLGATINQITSKDLNRFRFLFPPKKEQQKIAEILGACDEAIEAQERLIAQKQQRKKGLMQKLLTGDVRFPEFEGTSWKKTKAEELFKVRSEKNGSSAPVLSVTQDVGVVLRSDLDRRIMGASANFPNYKLVYPGDYVISLRSFQGGLEYSRIHGAVSPAYHVIYKRKQICEEFYRYFFKSWEFVGRLTVATIGIRDGKQISFRDFSFMKLPEPDVEEQKAISGFLCALDEEIALQQKQLEQLKQQKKGLMQQLLTGNVRVKV